MRRLLTIVFFSVLLVGLWSFGVREGYLKGPLPLFNKIFNVFGLRSPLSQVSPSYQTTTPTELYKKINQYRLSQKLSALAEDTSLCTALKGTKEAITDEVLSRCTSCIKASLITAETTVSPNEILTSLMFDHSTNQTLLDPLSTHLCLGKLDNTLQLLFIQKSTQDNPQPSPAVTRVTPRTMPTATPKNFTEAELWQALIDYRHAHRKTDIQMEESMCEYARKRVNDHVEAFHSGKKPEEYPNPDKYPLDAHDGFSKDADSGIVFEVTGKSHLAENLAYWPEASYPIHIIEWGWDTSTEGHREAQLSEEWTHGCISGKEGFYVAIFGR